MSITRVAAVLLASLALLTALPQAGSAQLPKLGGAMDALKGLPEMPSEAIQDIPGTSNSLVEKLGQMVGGLDAGQKEQTGSAISQFLGEFNDLLPLKQSDPTGFANGFLESAGGLNNKLKLAMGATKVAEALGIDATQVAGALFKLL